MKSQTRKFRYRPARRRSGLTAFAAVLLLCGGAPRAGAVISCQASSAPVIVRAEGIAELVAEIVLSCLSTAPAAGEVYQRVTINVDLNVNATNNRGFGFGLDVTDAVLVVNGNNTTSPVRFSILGGPNPRFPMPQYGRLASNRRLVWDQVNVPIPGASNFPATTTLRITNIRANAAQLNADPGTLLPPPITARVSTTGGSLFPSGGVTVDVAAPRPGINAGIGATGTPGTFLLRVREGFRTTLKLLGVPSFTPGAPSRETGYPTPFSGVNGGGATQATRMRIGFGNVPPGLQIRVPDQLANGDPVFFDRVMNAKSDCSGGFLISGPSMQLVPITDGAGVACYEVVRMEDPQAIEETEITIQTSGGSFAGVDVSVSLAPTSDPLVSDTGRPVPRFVDRGLLSRAGLHMISGNEQSGPEGSLLPIPLTVQVTDAAGFGIPGVEVTFSLREGNQQGVIGKRPTDTVGWASQPISLPRFPSVLEIIASAPGFEPLTFFVTAEPAGFPGTIGPRVQGVVGAGQSVPSVEHTSQNAIISVFGEEFAPEGTDVRVGPGDVVDGLLPFKLARTCVQVGRTIGRLFYVSPGQIDVQVPRQNINRDGLVQVIRNCGDPDEIRSTIRDIALRAASPEFFFFKVSPTGRNPIAAIDNTTNKFIGPLELLPGSEFAPARRDDIVTVFMTGLGETNPVFEAGEIADQAAPAIAIVRAFVNEQEVQVIYAGVTPGAAGLYQLSFRLGLNTPSGQVPVRVQADGFSTPTGGFLTVE